MRFLLLLGGMLLTGAAWAQQPALPGAPQPPAAGSGTPITGPALAPVQGSELVLGGRYEVTLQSGSTFMGTLTTISLDALEFDTADLGHLRVLRTEVRQVRGLAPAKPVGMRPGYYDIGNGNRLFFGPTARNLRQGEGVLQDAYVYLVGVNYGITDNISVGGYVSVIPGVSLSNQFVMLTPKVSVPLRENLHVGAGALYIRVPDFGSNNDNGYGVGLLYGALTWGSADNNLTAGIGYGFAGNGIGSTPTLMLGGQRRVSRRISIVSENYFIANSNSGGGGLYGLKLNWKRTNLGLAALYLFAYQRSNLNDSQFFTSYIVPVYVDFSFRFGKPYQSAKR